MEHMDCHQTMILTEEQKKSKSPARDGEDDTFYPPKKRRKLFLEFPIEKPVVAVYRWPDMIRNEEQKKLRLHPRDWENDTFYPPKKRMKLDLEFPKEKPLMADHRWTDMVNFQLYTLETTQVYTDMIIDCVNEIKAGQKAYDEASKFFEINFGLLKKRQPCIESSTVIFYFRDVEQGVKESLDKANEIFPFFKKHVENYIKFRNGPLDRLKPARDQYYNKLEELAEIPNIGKMMKELLYNVKDDKKIERFCLTRRDIWGIIHYLSKKYDFIPYGKEDKVNEKQNGESEAEDLFNQYKDLIEELPSIRLNCELAEDDFKRHVQEYGNGVLDYVWPMQDGLKLVDYLVRVMHRQLEHLTWKDVMNKGYDEDFDDEWLDIYRGGWN